MDLLKKNRIKIIWEYSCQSCSQCPVLAYAPEEEVVIILDPNKPERGSFTMSVDEYNQFIEKAKLIVEDTEFPREVMVQAKSKLKI